MSRRAAAFGCVLAVAVVLIAPVVAHAQASITGVVRDTSGAVLPGVTVEAASPALIEKVRSVVTDDSGQYRFVDLRPGVYAVTFTLPGFNMFNRVTVLTQQPSYSLTNATLWQTPQLVQQARLVKFALTVAF